MQIDIKPSIGQRWALISNNSNDREFDYTIEITKLLYDFVQCKEVAGKYKRNYISVKTIDPKQHYSPQEPYYSYKWYYLSGQDKINDIS